MATDDVINPHTRSEKESECTLFSRARVQDAIKNQAEDELSGEQIKCK